MPLDIRCDNPACGRELAEQGGVLWSPPNKDGWARKRHLCVRCTALVVEFIFGLPDEATVPTLMDALRQRRLTFRRSVRRARDDAD